ncbi:MAG: type III-A CRISPR-associated RAMP protein Csm3 [Candidatus Omnitrophica bacterium]|nr:type III-A CRISPR-associated RAMP protein Csm3 [Candidatus Omnitrophota bacterium]
MEEKIRESTLLGKVVIKGSIYVVTGLRIGGPTTGLKIGGVDQPVISDAFGKPYIPGSSLKGKLRTLIERKERVPLNKKDKEGNSIGHECDDEEKYNKCAICKIWGILGTDKIKGVPVLTRLIARDVYLDETSITEEMKKNLELEWTEIKMETAIDRYKGTALEGSLRTIERVPAGARFSPMEIIYNVYEESDEEILIKVFEAMELLEHDYLGGMGSRGYGKVEFKDIEVFWNKKEDYESGDLNKTKINDNFTTPSEIVKNFEEIKKKLTADEK